jgi:hypothetical protein
MNPITTVHDPANDKCACGHPRSAHDHRERACYTCAEHTFGFKCEYFALSYKIVNTDNYGGDYPDESFVAENIPGHGSATLMARALNEAAGPGASRFYKVVGHDYVLRPGFEP